MHHLVTPTVYGPGRWLLVFFLLFGLQRSGLAQAGTGSLNSYFFSAGGSTGAGQLQPWPGTHGGYLLSGYGRFSFDSSFMNLARLSPSLQVMRNRDYRLDIPLGYVFTTTGVGNNWLLGGATSGSFSGSTPYMACTDTMFARRWAVKFTNLAYAQRYIIKLLPEGTTGFAAYTYTDGGDDEAMYRLTGNPAGTRFRGKVMTPALPSLSVTGRLRVFEGISTGARPDQHYLVGTGRIFPGPHQQDGLILKVDSSRVRWGKLLHFGLDFESIYNIVLTSDNKLVVPIVNYGLAGAFYPTVVCKLDTAGTMLWSKELALPSESLFLPLVAETTQGDLVLAGVDAAYYLVVVKLSPTGNLIWARRSAGAAGIPNQLIRTPTGTFGLMSQGYLLTQFDAAGNGCSLVPAPTLSVTSITPTAATATDFPMTLTPFTPQTQNQPMLSRTQALTSTIVCVSNGLAEEVSANPLVLLPNPATGHVRLEGLADAQGHLPLVVLLIDALGREVRRQPVKAAAVELDLHGLPAGLYTVRAGERVSRLMVE